MVGTSVQPSWSHAKVLPWPTMMLSLRLIRTGALKRKLAMLLTICRAYFLL